MKTNISHSLEETQEIASRWLRGVVANEVAGDQNRAGSIEATVVGLSGHLGAGKTAFVKMVAKLLGVEGEITSPTFVIMKVYDIDTQDIPWKRLVHIDAYRLENPEETDALDFELLVADRHNLIMVEWSENVSLDKIVPDHHEIRFEVVDNEYQISF